MKLPEPILASVRQAFEPHHIFWHVARIPETEVPPEIRQLWEQSRAAFPALIARGSPGAGEQFLRFHRDMMRNYKWILQQHAGHGVTYLPWTAIPENVSGTLEGWGLDVQMHLRRVGELISQHSVDDLGNFIEPNPAGVGLHDYSHGAVTELEQDSTPEEFSMGNPATSHRNLVFYELHGWIDERLADWQRANGEQVDQSPLDPGHGGHHFWTGNVMLREIAPSEAEELMSRFMSFPRGQFARVTEPQP